MLGSTFVFVFHLYGVQFIFIRYLEIARVEPRSVLAHHRKQSTFSTRPQIIPLCIMLKWNFEKKIEPDPIPNEIVDAIQSVPGLGSSVD